MKQILTLSILLLSLTNKINCGSYLSTLSNEESITPQIWQPGQPTETLLTNIKNEIEKLYKTLNYSSYITHEQLLEKIQNILNEALQSNPQALPNFSSYMQNSESFGENEEFQKKLENIIKETSFSFAKQKCQELEIPITIDEN